MATTWCRDITDTSSLYDYPFNFTGPRFVVQIGEKTIDYNENFRLFLTTRNPSPEIPPDAASVITEVNFTTTRAGLTGQVNKGEIIWNTYSRTWIIWPSLVGTTRIIRTIVINTIVCFPIDFDVWIIHTFCLICTNFLQHILCVNYLDSCTPVLPM